LPAFRDVEARPNVTEKHPRLEPRCSDTENPAKFIVMTPEPEFDRERLSRIERPFVDVEQMVDVFRMNPFRPAESKLLVQGAPREFKPAFVQKIPKLIRARHPDHDRRDIGRGAKSLFAFSQGPLRPAASHQVRDEGHDKQSLED